MENQIPNLRLIIDGCVRGNSGSQKRLYEDFYGFGMNVALRYSNNKAQAQEILNDSFLKVFKNIEMYDPSYPFSSWLKKIITNTAIDYYRKYKKHNELIIDTDNVPDRNYEEARVFADEETDMLPIIQKLPPAYRMVFNLYVMEEYKHHEIAELLNISVGASKSNLARAKGKLKEMIISRAEFKKINSK